MDAGLLVLVICQAVFLALSVIGLVHWARTGSLRRRATKPLLAVGALAAAVGIVAAVVVLTSS